MVDPLVDPRLDELLWLGDRCGRVSALLGKIKPYLAGNTDQQALFQIEYALRQRFWTLAHTIAGELPR